MSAIFGILNRDGRPVDPSNLALMSESMAHRGPDDQGVWFNGSSGLGQRMLQTTPESLHEKIPAFLESSQPRAVRQAAIEAAPQFPHADEESLRLLALMSELYSGKDL